jgi:hypothetical protein
MDMVKELLCDPGLISGSLEIVSTVDEQLTSKTKANLAGFQLKQIQYLMNMSADGLSIVQPALGSGRQTEHIDAGEPRVQWL